jgi:hypothetical protein
MIPSVPAKYQTLIGCERFCCEPAASFYSVSFLPPPPVASFQIILRPVAPSESTQINIALFHLFLALNRRNREDTYDRYIRGLYIGMGNEFSPRLEMPRTRLHTRRAVSLSSARAVHVLSLVAAPAISSLQVMPQPKQPLVPSAPPPAMASKLRHQKHLQTSQPL